jgi:hypothetical protein
MFLFCVAALSLGVEGENLNSIFHCHVDKPTKVCCSVSILRKFTTVEDK